MTGNKTITQQNGGTTSNLQNGDIVPAARGGSTYPVYMNAPGPVLGGKLASANMNSTADQAIALSLPPNITKYRIHSIVIVNPSISLTTAKGGVYAAASKTTPVTSGTASTFAYSPLTTNAANSSGNLLSMSLNDYVWNATTLYLSLSTAQGAAATADVYVFIVPLP